MAGESLLEADRAVVHGATPTAPAPEDAQVELRFEADADGCTFIASQRVRYPFHLGRSLHVPGDPRGMPTYYVQCCSGGLFAGDRLRWRIAVGTDARVHLTGSASTVVHEAREDCARQEVCIEAAPGSYVEYLPDPMILLPGARLASSVRVCAHPGATVLSWDALVPHDHTGRGGSFDWIDASLRVEAPGGRLRARDRYLLHGATWARRLPGVTGTHACQAGFAVVSDLHGAPELMRDVRTALAGHAAAYACASALPDSAGLWVRLLAPDAHVLRAALYSAWSAVRRVLLGAAPSVRRK